MKIRTKREVVVVPDGNYCQGGALDREPCKYLNGVFYFNYEKIENAADCSCQIFGEIGEADSFGYIEKCQACIDAEVKG